MSSIHERLLDSFQTPVHCVKAFLAYRQEQGIAQTFKRLRNAIWSRHRYAVLKNDLSGLPEAQVAVSEAAAGEIQFQVFENCDPQSIPRACIDEPPFEWPDTLPQLRARLGSGEILILGWLRDKVVWRSWLLRKDWKFVRARLAVDHASICHCSLRCLSEYRRRGVAGSALKFVAALAKARGYAGIYAFVRLNNTASMMLHQRCKYHTMGYAEFYEIIGHCRTRWQEPGGAIIDVCRAPHVQGSKMMPLSLQPGQPFSDPSSSGDQ